MRFYLGFRCQSDRQMKNRTAGTIFDPSFVAEELYNLDSAAFHLTPET